VNVTPGVITPADGNLHNAISGSRCQVENFHIETETVNPRLGKELFRHVRSEALEAALGIFYRAELREVEEDQQLYNPAEKASHPAPIGRLRTEKTARIELPAPDTNVGSSFKLL